MTDPGEIRARLLALAALLPRLEAEGAGRQFGEWVAMREARPGVMTMPWVRYGPLEAAFRAAASFWVRPDIDWGAWAQTEEARSIEGEPARLARATPEELAHLLTTVVRGDRFNEGMLLGEFERGVIAGIARRAAVLASDPVELAAVLALDAARDPPAD